MKIRLISDIHLEFVKHENDIPNTGCGDVLLLGGDILVTRHLRTFDHNGNALPYNKSFDNSNTIYRKFLQKCSDNYNQIVYVMGNHEYYGSDITVVDEWFPRYLEDNYPRVKIINNSSVDIGNNLAIVGGTLWTNYNNEDPNAMVAAQKSLNDFRRISYAGRNITPNTIVELHKITLSTIKEYVASNPYKNVLIMTHHAPSRRSTIERYKFSPVNSAYTNDYDEFILTNPNIKYWVHGHTHSKFNYSIGQCEVLCNPYGYHGVECEDHYSPIDVSIKY